MDPAPLHGLRIVEFSAFVAAPSAGLALAQLGADVIRVDPIGGNIDVRRAPLNAAGRSQYWASLNRGKRSVEIDVRQPEGRALLQQLICAASDGPPVFLTNLGVDKELSYAALSAIRPDLIMVQLTGSPDGSGAVDYTVNCAAGFPYLTGHGNGPVNHVLPAWDLLAGATLVQAVLVAERQWRLSGQGRHLKLALSDVAMAAAANLGYLADVEVNGAQRSADGNFLYGAYGDSFACADGRHAMVVAITDRQWTALLRSVGLHDALEAAAAALGHRLDSETARYAARELISTALRPWFAQRSLADVAAVLGADRSILWGPYRSFAQMLAEDPRCSTGNPMFSAVDHPGVGRFLTARSPLSIGGAQPLPPGIAPQLGEHTAAVLGEALGLDAAALAALQQRALIGGVADR
jgi:2-methylfumaryl-CoA isomerase